MHFLPCTRTGGPADQRASGPAELEGAGRPFPLTRLPRNVFETALAPGGRWLAAMYADREMCPCIRVVDLEGRLAVPGVELSFHRGFIFPRDIPPTHYSHTLPRTPLASCR